MSEIKKRASIQVFKRDGRIQPFRRNKLITSMTKAGATQTQANRVGDRVIKLIGTHTKVTSKELAITTARSLSRVNLAASARYSMFKNKYPDGWDDWANAVAGIRG